MSPVALVLLLLLGFAPASELNAATAVAQGSADPSCGTSPDDWCAGSSSDPCGVHKNEASCRSDARCRGLPYRGESVVACIPDAHGFWSNCPAVGCVSRYASPGAPLPKKVAAQLCSAWTFGHDGAEVRVWRSTKDEATILETHARSEADDAPTFFYDKDGRALLSIPSKHQFGRSDLGRRLDQQRSGLLSNLHVAEIVSCEALSAGLAPE